MDQDPPKPAGRKVKYAPKGPPRRTAKAAKIEVVDDEDADEEVAEQKPLPHKLKEQLSKRGTKAEKKSSVQVAFAHGAASSERRTSTRRAGTITQSDASRVECSALDDQQTKQVTTTSTDAVNGFGVFAGSPNAFTVKKKSVYKEPWDYLSYYPTTLPLRKPGFGNPELLDKEEFENAVEYDESTLNSASELGLLDEDDESQMLLFRFPDYLPLSSESKGKEKVQEIAHSLPPPRVLSATSKGKEKVDSTSKGKEKVDSSSKEKGKVDSTPRASTGAKGKGGNPTGSVSGMEKLPKGYLGKMLVYKSGAVKLKLGDILYDISPGSDCMFAQSAVAVDTTNKDCVELGKPNKRAVITPNIDYLLARMID